MVKSLNYWLLTTEYPPFSGGGISTYCYETANMFAAKGHRVKIFTQDHSVSAIKEEILGPLKIIRFNPNTCYTNFFLGYEANLSYAFAETVKTYINQEGTPDIIEAQEYKGIAYYLLQFKYLNYPEFANLRVLITLHSPSFLYLQFNQVIFHRFPYYWTTEMEKFCIAGADMLISPSRYLIEEIGKQIDLSDRHIYVVSNPYQVNLADKIPAITKNKIIFFGKLTPQKGCLELLAYFSQLWKEGLTYPLIMIGNGDYTYDPEGISMNSWVEQKYKKEIHQGLLKMSGPIQPDQLAVNLEDAHVIIVPSLVDNMPYTVLESMAKGKIVLASVQGGQKESIENNQNGFLFNHYEKNSFQSQLQKILNLGQADIIRIGKNACLAIKEKHSYETIYKTKIELIEELIKTKKENIFPFIRPIKPLKPLVKTNKEEQPLLSVIIPYYNMGKYVIDTIHSLKNTIYKNIEIILVNDGSDDVQSINILSVLEAEYSIKIINQNNSGLSLARNTGAKEASGTFLAFLDPDDTIEPSYYTKAIQVLQKYSNVYFVGCWAKYFGDAQHYWPTFNPEPPYLLYHNMVNSSALVYKKEAFFSAGFNDKKMLFGMEDYESVINLVKNGYHGVVLPEALWNYRSRKNSMARAFTTNKKLYLYRLISMKHAGFYSEHAAEISNLLNANGPGIHIDNPTLIYDVPEGNSLRLLLRYKVIRKLKSYPKLVKLIRAIKSKVI